MGWCFETMQISRKSHLKNEVWLFNYENSVGRHFRRRGNSMWEVPKAKSLELFEKERKIPLQLGSTERKQYRVVDGYRTMQGLEAEPSIFYILSFNTNAGGKPSKFLNRSAIWPKLCCRKSSQTVWGMIGDRMTHLNFIPKPHTSSSLFWYMLYCRYPVLLLDRWLMFSPSFNWKIAFKII